MSLIIKDFRVIPLNPDEWKIEWYNKPYDLWLTDSTDRFKTKEEAEKAMKKRKNEK